MVLHTNKFELSSLNRALLWIILLILTVTLLLYPVNFTNEYKSIQAPYIFDNLALFCLLFLIWLVVMFSLVFLKPEKDKPYWENTLLAAIFGLVFMGFWVVITPYGSYADGIYNMGIAKYLVDYGDIPIGHHALLYFEYPGMHIILSNIALLCGLDIFESRLIFLLFNAMLFSALLYLFFTRTTKSSRIAFFSLLFVILSSIMLIEKMHIFTPGAFGFTLMALLLAVMSIKDNTLFGNTVADKLLMLTVLFSMTISYFATTFLTVMILFSTYIIFLIKKYKQSPVLLNTMTLLVILMFGWQIYWTWHTFSTLVNYLTTFTMNIISGEFLTFAVSLFQVNVGSSLPIWASITRLFWWVLLGISTIVGLCSLFNMKRLGFSKLLILGGLIGCILLTAISLFSTTSGNQFARYLLYAPIFCAPILLSYIININHHRRIFYAVLSILLLTISIPTFLSSVNTINTDAIYHYDLAPAELLNDNRTVDSLVMFGVNNNTLACSYYYTPNAKLHTISQFSFLDIDVFWQEVDVIKNAYISQKTNGQNLFIFSEKSVNVYEHLLNISPTDPKWLELDKDLTKTSLFYNNGHVRMFVN